MFKNSLALFFLVLSTFFAQAQDNKELAQKYLESRGEVAFSFQANSKEEIRELANIISFDSGQPQLENLIINAVANKKGFQKFLQYNLPFTVNIAENEPKVVEMFDPKVHKKGVSEKNATYTLNLPLIAYPTYDQYVQQMNDFVNDHPTIARLVNIGSTPGSAAGVHDLLFIVLSDNVNTQEQEPRVMYTSSMHGDELAGYPLMLNLIDYFIEAYNNSGHSDHTRVSELLNGSEVWINPLANPDGTYVTSNASVSAATRGNANNIDLNRNYPAPDGTLHPDGESYQAETLAFMNFAEDYNFVIAANFHGGTEVINYPWDYTYTRHPDDDWLFFVSKEYAVNCQNNSPSGYMDAMYTNYVWPGVTNGADWYVINGGRQDYMNFEHHVKEITHEISNVKLIAASEINNHWNYNREALIDYLMQGTYGFRGVVKDAVTGDPILAKITLIEGGVVHDALGSWVETELPFGDYYRPTIAGTYDILIEADCYQPYTITNQTIANYETKVLPEVLLTPITADTPTNVNASNITAATALVSWDDMGVSIYDFQYRQLGSSTWLTSTVNSTFVNLSNLNSNTTYEYQIRSICNTSVSNYSNLKTFTTTVNYCSSSGDTTDKGIVNVTFNGETTINNSDTVNNNSGYEDFTNQMADVYLGQTYNLSASINTGNGNNILYTRVFIDFNRDGDFNDAGESFDLGTVTKSANALTSGSPLGIDIPSLLVGGQTGIARMRIASKQGSYPTSCETFSNGEVEDYTLNIIDASLGIQDEILSAFNLYPNPVSNGKLSVTVPNEIDVFTVTVSGITGRQLFTTTLQNYTEGAHQISVPNLKTGIYFVTVSTNLGKASKKLIVQ